MKSLLLIPILALGSLPVEAEHLSVVTLTSALKRFIVKNTFLVQFRHLDVSVVTLRM
jgi:hypothetical protein